MNKAMSLMFVELRKWNSWKLVVRYRGRSQAVCTYGMTHRGTAQDAGLMMPNEIAFSMAQCLFDTFSFCSSCV